MATAAVTPLSPLADSLPAPFVLQEAQVRLTEKSYCRNQYMPPIGLPADQMLSFREDNICAHDPSVEKSMCAVSDVDRFGYHLSFICVSSRNSDIPKLLFLSPE